MHQHLVSAHEFVSNCQSLLIIEQKELFLDHIFFLMCVTSTIMRIFRKADKGASSWSCEHGSTSKTKFTGQPVQLVYNFFHYMQKAGFLVIVAHL